MNTKNTFSEVFTTLGINIPCVLLPQNIETATWATIACDQFTQSPQYWQSVADAVASNPSTLNITLPEIFLNDKDVEARISNIKQTMQDYLSSDQFCAQNEFVFVARTLPNGKTRHGLVLALDLEKYDYSKDTTSLIRPTEATIAARIPPRVRIRKGAALECPHIMVLINDECDLLFSTLRDMVCDEKKSPIYEGALMTGAGSIKGYSISQTAELAKVADALNEVAQENTSDNGDTFLFAVGDGNHSLATAKAVWEEYKAAHPSEPTHPLRYALVEAVNIYDDSLDFKAIHRALFGADFADFKDYFAKKTGAAIESCADFDELSSVVAASDHTIGLFLQDGDAQQCYLAKLPSCDTLAVSTIQPILDDYIAARAGVLLDYIHDDAEVKRVACDKSGIGVLLPPIQKDAFFKTILARGVLPRKSFSMGSALDKRFYLECRALA